MKNIKKGSILKFEDLIVIKENQTISKKIVDNDNYYIAYMSFYNMTDISSEYYAEEKLYIVFQGELLLNKNEVSAYEAILLNREKEFCIKSKDNSIILEISTKLKGNEMNNILKGEVINLKDALEYVDGGIANIDLISREGLKMMILAFDAGEGLKPHSARADALIIPLEGRACLSVGDKKFEITVGEQLVFPKDVIHNVEAITKFKMLIILAND